MQRDYLDCGDDYLNCGDDYLNCGDDVITPNPAPSPAKDNWLLELLYKVMVFINTLFKKRR